ncbi:phosphoribosyl transferase [Methanosarcina sp. 2.H.T.1A.6]|uniref:phosphoribosyltransferase n=1 Tax=unclassified Methanosarcina TaxID=2644672 RepID=UPI000620FDFC|nr:MULTISPECIES: phosphoribosyltransferase [unclassified Methanosarcina]KKG14789.1 phosphoribosyl transferase [Methanosarcina sp. 2.H.T.1A.3]KKG23764.1 phosphoribosyl transferase [Methanosarcina sp. 2.H.T.1A.15]KKG23921.1 phosphoribosyl transferase [Methanosarcina sp. 2.H.T.1A.6]KKG26441.1 phosphoribosyl transferase [Methanosarcina sp. 2.H.T.1A.8]
MAIFKNRADAGKRLAKELMTYSNRPDVLILALPRGGVPVAFEVAKKLNVKMDVFVVRKLGVPGNEDLAMGAIASEDVRVLNEDIVRSFKIPDRVIATIAINELRELERRERIYRRNHPKLNISGMTVILIDDGIATGASMHAVVEALKTKNPAKLVVAVPTASPDTRSFFEDKVDEIICITTPEPFYSVGTWYGDFSQTTDEEVCELLDKARNFSSK